MSKYICIENTSGRVSFIRKKYIEHFYAMTSNDKNRSFTRIHIHKSKAFSTIDTHETVGSLLERMGESPK